MVLNFPCSGHPGTDWEPRGQSWHDHPILLAASGDAGTTHPPLLESSFCTPHCPVHKASDSWYLHSGTGFCRGGWEEKRRKVGSGAPRVIGVPVQAGGGRAGWRGWGAGGGAEGWSSPFPPRAELQPLGGAVNWEHGGVLLACLCSLPVPL